MSKIRKSERLTVSIPGFIYIEREPAPCELVNVSSSGLLLRSVLDHIDDPHVYVRIESLELEEPVVLEGFIVRKRRGQVRTEWAIQLDRSRTENIATFDQLITDLGRKRTGYGRPASWHHRSDVEQPSLEHLYKSALDQLDRAS